MTLADLAARLPPAPSPGQTAVYRLVDGLPPHDIAEAAMFARLLGRPWRASDARRYPRVVLKAGRGSGKSTIASRFALHRALDERVHDLAPGQMGYVPIVAPLREKAMEVLHYVRGAVTMDDALRRYCLYEPGGTVTFKRGSTVMVSTADRGGLAVRGISILAIVLDEANLFRDKASGVVNDRDVLEAAEARLRGQALLISSPWVEAGMFHSLFCEHFGRSEDDVLALDCEHPSMLNPAWALPAGVVPGTTAHAREVEGKWVGDHEDVLFPREAVQASMRAPGEVGAPLLTAVDALDLAGSGTARTAHAIGGYDAGGHAVVASVESWAAAVPIEDRFRAIAQRRAAAGVMGACAADQFAYDAAEAVGRLVGVPLRRDTGARAAQASYGAELVRAGGVSLPHSPRLLRDLPALRLRRSPGGATSLVVPARDPEGGHCDEAVAVVLLLASLSSAIRPVGLRMTARADPFARG